MLRAINLFSSSFVLDKDVILLLSQDKEYKTNSAGIECQLFYQSSSIPILPSFVSRMAIGRVAGISDNIIINITVIGTLKNNPIIPQMAPQNASPKIIINGLMFNESPVSLGSM